MDTPASRLPVEIDRSSETAVKIEWQDSHRSDYPARILRLLCPCADCVDESTGIRILNPDSVPVDVRAVGIRMVGRYAVEITWSDGHDTGFYSFETLRRLCSCSECGNARATK